MFHVKHVIAQPGQDVPRQSKSSCDTPHKSAGPRLDFTGYAAGVTGKSSNTALIARLPLADVSSNTAFIVYFSCWQERAAILRFLFVFTADRRGRNTMFVTRLLLTGVNGN